MAIAQHSDEQWLKGKSGGINEDRVVKMRLEVEG